MKAEAKKRLTQFVNSLFAVVLVVGLLPTWALSNPQQAYAAPADYTVTATVDGLDDDTLPVLVGGTDFTPGQPVNADPVYYTDANGNTPLADLAAQKAKQGLSLKWIDAETGKDFSWTETPINKSYEVEGTGRPGGAIAEPTLLFRNVPSGTFPVLERPGSYSCQIPGSLVCR